MSCLNKYDILINQAEKVCNEPKNPSEIAKKLFYIQKEIISLKEKDEKKNKELLLENREISDFLDGVVNESEILTTVKSKKFKKDITLLLLDDIIEYVCFVNERNVKEINHAIPLPNFTHFMFGSKHNFIIKSPVLYKCSNNKIEILKDAILLKECPYIFNIKEITKDLNIQKEFTDLNNKYKN